MADPLGFRWGPVGRRATSCGAKRLSLGKAKGCHSGAIRFGSSHSEHRPSCRRGGGSSPPDHSDRVCYQLIYIERVMITASLGQNGVKARRELSERQEGSEAPLNLAGGERGNQQQPDTNEPIPSGEHIQDFGDPLRIAIHVRFPACGRAQPVFVVGVSFLMVMQTEHGKIARWTCGRIRSMSEYTIEQYCENYPTGIERYFWNVARNAIIARSLKRGHMHTWPLLDIGCGRGIVVEYLRSQGINCIGCDTAAAPVSNHLRESSSHARMSLTFRPRNATPSAAR
jgi:hypothetical protein